ncbi:MAG: argininosuccinate lyase [Planctomycetes bacterium]|nr:argininosuccinate lyase [Planctomycetota bacterium]
MYQKLWQNRLNRKVEYPLVEDFNASIGFDKRLAEEDITGSLAYARALQKAGVITGMELKKLVKSLNQIKANIKKGKLNLNGSEDIHTAIEMALTRKLGNTGRKIHTGRSRNEQVALDERLYLKKNIKGISKDLIALQKAILKRAEKHVGVVMPGYTHLQQAQPVLFSYYLMALFFMLQRDKERLVDCLKRVDICPLGSGALAGTTYNINRRQLARELGFKKISENALDATSDRDFIVEFIGTSSILMMHLSRICEDLIIWSSREFGFVVLADALTTSSSLMPQKKNPDLLELIRGKSGRVFGHLLGLLSMLKSLPVGYNKDMQEDKLPLFDTVDTLSASLKIFTLVFKTMTIKPQKMQATINDHILATDLVDYLVQKGVPFRESHSTVGQIVRYTLDYDKNLIGLSLSELKQFNPKFQKDVYQVFNIKKSIDAHNLPGGTSEAMVRKQIKTGKKYLSNH